jgi:hypothetical protein
MPKLVTPLTDAQVKNAKPKTKPYKLSDGGGLYLEVMPTGSKLWRMKFTRANGKESRLAFGSYPEASVLKKRKLSSGEITEIYISDSIPDGQANHIARNVVNQQSAIEVDIEFNCSLHGFSKSTGHLGGVLPRFINQHTRTGSHLTQQAAY